MDIRYSGKLKASVQTNVLMSLMASEKCLRDELTWQDEEDLRARSGKLKG